LVLAEYIMLMLLAILIYAVLWGEGYEEVVIGYGYNLYGRSCKFCLCR